MSANVKICQLPIISISPNPQHQSRSIIAKIFWSMYMLQQFQYLNGDHQKMFLWLFIFLFSAVFWSCCNIPADSFCLAKVSFDYALAFQRRWIICLMRAISCSDLAFNYFLITYLAYLVIVVHYFLCKVVL